MNNMKELVVRKKERDVGLNARRYSNYMDWPHRLERSMIISTVF